MTAAGVLLVAAPFVWWGMVAAISLIEAPLKFRAPGVTLALGLGIGRLVFRALNAAEAVLLVVLTAAAVVSPPGAVAAGLVAGLWVLLAVQVLVLRPRLDRRARLIIDGAEPGPSSLHRVYIALEGVKLLALPVLGVLLALR
ncbi:membrane protein [Microbispora sp. ATCC PTA-5024]|uniref:membrane protein n=1 Tax=Microbispora sp. ATCC PTA-5024 TaxID=316330 RepID=UPI0003DC8D58|nr:membrane protein [Microbispora sp. ATCC PTA-5024]ETK31370.1 membrane protein [Microbispora sp. ATCC PTA-5024]